MAEFVSYLEYEHKKALFNGCLAVAKRAKQLVPELPPDGIETQCCGMIINLRKVKKNMQYKHFSMRKDVRIFKALRVKNFSNVK